MKLPLYAAMALLSASCSQILQNAKKSTEQRPAATNLLTGGTHLTASVVRSSMLSVVRQPVTTAKLGAVVLWHRPREAFTSNLPMKTHFIQVPDCPPGCAEFEATLDRNKFPRAEHGKLTWLIDGPGFFPEFDRQMAAAKKRIDVQVFIFDNDDIAVRYADRLKARSSQVNVRVLFDDLGSTFAQTAAPETPAPAGFHPPANIKSYLKSDSRVRVRRIANPWLVADHTKLMVFDEQVAVLGGMNIGREYYSEWHDLMIKVEGPIVPSLGREFRRAWKKAGPAGDLGLFRKPEKWRKPPPISTGSPLRILRTDPGEGRYEIMESNLMAISAARKRIWIENPYLAHDDTVLALAAAARRGVDVRIILPAQGDSTIMDVGNLSSSRILIQAGAKVYRYPRMTHMKVLLCDGWASVGSANLDTLSMCINRELNLGFSDPGEIRHLEEKIFQPDFRFSQRMTLQETNSLLSGLAETVADQL